MKLLLTLLLGLVGLVIVLGGLGAVVEDTLPAQTHITDTNIGNTGAQEGNPTLLFICVFGVIAMFLIGFDRGR